MEPVALDIVMTDLTYDPDDITVALGAEVTITATSGDAFGKHNLLIVFFFLGGGCSASWSK